MEAVQLGKGNRNAFVRPSMVIAVVALGSDSSTIYLAGGQSFPINEKSDKVISKLKMGVATKKMAKKQLHKEPQEHQGNLPATAPPNAGKKWSVQEETDILARWELGNQTIAEIADFAGRTHGSIVAKLAELLSVERDSIREADTHRVAASGPASSDPLSGDEIPAA